jgi:hypothetical protein
MLWPKPLNSSVMVEVFKTNVNDDCHANLLIEEIHNQFVDYAANFDLEDCDRILRIKSQTGTVKSFVVINLLRKWGYEAEILQDVTPFPAPILQSVNNTVPL